MTRAEAFAGASGAVSIIRYSRTSYEIRYPYRDQDLYGPTTSTTADSYPMAVARARNIKARIAARLLGADEETASEAEHLADRTADWRQAVREALRAE